MVSANRPSGPIYGGDEPLAGLIGEAPAFKSVKEQISLIAPCDKPVLITGETGTGKELVANAIHRLSTRRDRAFVPFNCGHRTDSLIEDELFGHEEGAYTDARHSRPGLIALADGGTLMLDEVDSLGARGQVGLLRFLDGGRYRPLGSSDERSADVRIVAATNTFLEGQVERGAFREDLFYRLAVMTVHLPPLRERGEDVLLLARHLLSQKVEAGAPVPTLTREVEAALLSQPWDGNVRELENAMTRAAQYSRGGVGHVDDLGLTASAMALARRAGYGPTFKGSRALCERSYLIALLARHGGNLHSASREAVLDRAYLRRLYARHGLREEISRRPSPGSQNG